MTETPVHRLVLKLGFPAIISMLITNIYNLTDTYFVSSLGKSQSGATGIVFALMALIQAFGFTLGHGCGGLISRFLGDQKKEQVAAFSATAFYGSILSGVLLGILSGCFLTPLLNLLGSTDSILPYARTYAVYILISTPAMMCAIVLNNLLRYEGKAAYAMTGLASGGLLNILLDFVFIRILKLAMHGAGIACTVSQYLSVLVLLIPFLKGKSALSIRPADFAKDLKIILEILKNGVPSLLRQGLSFFALLLLNRAIRSFGDEAIASVSIASRISNLIFCIGLGIGQGFQPVCAYNYGAKQFKRVKSAAIFSFLFSEILLLALTVVSCFFSKELMGLFQSDKQIVAIGQKALYAQSLSLITIPLSACGNMMFQSVSKEGLSSFLASLRNGICFFPLILLLPRFFGINGVLYSQAIADIVAAFISLPFLVHFLHELSREDRSAQKT